MAIDRTSREELVGRRVATTKGDRIEGEITFEFATEVYVVWDDNIGGFHRLEDLELVQ